MSIGTVINRFVRLHAPTQAALKASISKVDPAFSPSSIRRLSTFLENTTGTFQLAVDSAVLAFLTNWLVMQSAGLAFTDFEKLFSLDLAQWVEVNKTKLAEAWTHLQVGRVFVDIEQDLFDFEGLFHTQFSTLSGAVRVLVNPTGTPVDFVGIIASSGSGLDTGTVGPGQVGLFRTAVGLTAAPVYGGDAVNDDLADLLDFVTVNKL